MARYVVREMLNILMDFTTLYLNDNAKCSNTTMLLSLLVACTKQKVPRLKGRQCMMRRDRNDG